MEELKIEVITDLSTIPSKIESNAEELKKLLVPRLEYYNNLVVTEDGIRDAKSDKAISRPLRNSGSIISYLLTTIKIAEKSRNFNLDTKAIFSSQYVRDSIKNLTYYR